MTFSAIYSTLLTKKPIFPLSNDQNSPNHCSFNSHPTQYLYINITHPLSTRSNSLHARVNSLGPAKSSSQNHPFKRTQPIQELFILFTFSITLLLFRLISNALLPSFPLRWRNLVAFSQQNEPTTRGYPSHLWQAVVAYEDKRFFSHFGVDPVGISRAVLSLSARGGGSTITQQVTILLYCLFFSPLFIACQMFDVFTEPSWILLVLFGRLVVVICTLCLHCLFGLYFGCGK